QPSCTISSMSPGSGESCIVIENARIGGQGLGSIVLGSDGTVLPAAQGDVRTFDAGGRVVVPAFAEPHAHLDRAFSQGITGANQSGTLLEASRRGGGRARNRLGSPRR